MTPVPSSVSDCLNHAVGVAINFSNFCSWSVYFKTKATKLPIPITSYPRIPFIPPLFRLNDVSKNYYQESEWILRQTPRDRSFFEKGKNWNKKERRWEDHP